MKRILASTICIALAASVLTACSGPSKVSIRERKDQATAETAGSQSDPLVLTPAATAPAATPAPTAATTPAATAAPAKPVETPVPAASVKTADPLQPLEISGGALQAEAPMLLPNTRYMGKYKEGELWLAFTTGPRDDVLYAVTLENLTADSKDLYAYVFEGSGDQVVPTGRNNNDYNNAFCVAGPNGTANTGTSNELKPDTTYHIRVTGNGRTQFSLRVTDPDKTPYDAAADRPAAPDSDTFEAASNQDDAPLLSFNTRYQGKYREGYDWVAFTTGPDEDVSYSITLDNLTADSNDLYAYVFDEFGNQVEPTARNNNDYYKAFCVAGQDGTASTGTNGELQPDTTYFVRISGKSKAAYSVRITAPDAELFDPAADRATFADSDEYETASNQDEAPLLTFHTQYRGKYREGCGWVAFTTGADEDVPYSVTLENLTAGSKDLYAYVFDEFGNQVEPTTRNNNDYYKAFCVADQNGTANTGTSSELLPDTTYFIRISGNGKAEYALTLTSPTEEKAAGKEAEPEEEDKATDAGEKKPAEEKPADTETETEEDKVSDTREEAEKEDTPADTEEKTEDDDAADGGAETTVESNIAGTALQDSTIVPGSSQSSALTLPLGTKVYGKYTDGYAWLAFTTTEKEDLEYALTLTDLSVGSKDLYAYVFDEFGDQVIPTSRNNNDYYRAFCVAEQDGTANTGRSNALKPNTRYYIRIEGKSKAGYSFCVSVPSQKAEALRTSSSLSEAQAGLREEDGFYTGTDQDAATMLRPNIHYRGKYEDGFSWVAFTTGEREDVPYSVTLENTTVGSDDLYAYVFDEYGDQVIPTDRNNNDYYKAFCAAGQDGTANTGVSSELKPNTTYYVRIQGGSKAEYILTIGEPEPEENGNTVEKVPEEAEQVFEVPFELNETQVRFVADKADFLDENAAKEALAPVAEIILAHPDHPILIAGTTATFGEQEGCLKLSASRAEAVKDLLVREFKVPESQLVTAGLGYEKDPFVRGRDVDAEGNFVETEGAKNRRVVVLDAESETARGILGG